MYQVEDKLYPCTTSLTMRYIGGKWKSVILVHLANGTKRYNELRKDIPTMTERTLSLQLKQLEDDGLISREVFTDKPPLRVEYTLTAFGKTLLPVLNAISDWGRYAASTQAKVTDLDESHACTE